MSQPAKCIHQFKSSIEELETDSKCFLSPKTVILFVFLSKKSNVTLEDKRMIL